MKPNMLATKALSYHYFKYFAHLGEVLLSLFLSSFLGSNQETTLTYSYSVRKRHPSLATLHG